MDYLEDVSTRKYDAWFVDLFVRAKNSIAIGMYRRLGYNLYRVISKYYSRSEKEPAEDAHGRVSSADRYAEVSTSGQGRDNIEAYPQDYPS